MMMNAKNHLLFSKDREKEKLNEMVSNVIFDEMENCETCTTD